MKKRILSSGTGVLFLFWFQSAQAQQAESFFPYHVGDRWDYRDLNSGQVTSKRLTRDSIGADGSHSLFYNNAVSPEYRIDTTLNVFSYPRSNYLRYKLGADSCVSWENLGFGSIRWAWVASVDSIIVFSRRTVGKVFRYAPGNPCSLGSLEEDWLAAGFGLIYMWREPNEITYLQGCIIAGDTFGIITSVPQMTGPPHEYILNQNFPNPFNPSTTVEFLLPEAADVDLFVDDILGRQVAKITEGNMAAGVHRVVWTAEGLASGVYLGRLQVNGSVRTIKMLLTK
jgi:hypothetical protein